MLLAAADSAGDPVLIWRAAAALGLSPEAGGAAEEADLLSVGVRIAFRHPLVRSAVYRPAAPESRRRVHQALADATCAQTDPDRRAWHLAHATEGRDDHVAAELESSAGRAQARGGLAAAAAFLERAATLTADPELRAERELGAARNKVHAGAPTGPGSCSTGWRPGRPTNCARPTSASCAAISRSPPETSPRPR
ncbi:hypothetical protein ACFQ9X_00405 [Catenulispora yoronensis]